MSYLISRMLLGGASVALAIVGGGCNKAAARVEPPPPKVTVANPQTRQIVASDDYNGWMQAMATVDVRARVRGHIQKIDFKDGEIVKKDQVLFELDPRPFESEIGRSQDQVKVYAAQLVAAQKDEARQRELLKKGGASQSQVDKAEADALSLQAQIDAGQQEIKRKELDLEYSKITSPMTGRAGRAMLDVGNLVNAGGSDPVLTTIVSTDPIQVYFYVDERSIQRYQKARGPRASGQLNDLNLKFTFGLETDVGFPNEGVLDFADNRIDKATGTVQLRGLVKNDKGRFAPGSRVRIRVPISDEQAAVVVPDIALLADQDKKYALVLDAKNVVQRRDVVLGTLLDDGMRIVMPGEGVTGGALTPEDRIVVLGLQAARINYPVEPVMATTQPSK
jgi:multidrug efflux system membrane fusion protein